MRSVFQILTFLGIATVTIYSQEVPSRPLKIGDPAPPLRVKQWIKAGPVQKFEKGNIYVVEFWATWCRPCIEVMPHLSELAREYKGKVFILGIDIYEKKTTSPEKIKAFVDSMGHGMDYHVALQDSNFMEADWIDASGEQLNGIPRSYVINGEGILVWIGLPSGLDSVLPKVISNQWNLKEAAARHDFNRYLKNLDSIAGEDLNRFVGDPYKPGDLGKPDSALAVINELVTKEPKLKYAPRIAFHTFSSLLKTDPQKAYQYGQEVLTTFTYEDPPYGLIISLIKWYSTKIEIPQKIYELGADTYHAEIDQYPASMKNIYTYQKMAEWYYRAGNKDKAIDGQQKAIEALKSKKIFNTTDLNALESLLQKYKNM